MFVPIAMMSKASTMRIQLKIMRGFVTWLGCTIAPTENAQVTMRNIASMRPAKETKELV